jgi:hypothetical protein
MKAVRNSDLVAAFEQPTRRVVVGELASAGDGRPQRHLFLSSEPAGAAFAQPVAVPPEKPAELSYGRMERRKPAA